MFLHTKQDKILINVAVPGNELCSVFQRENVALPPSASALTGRVRRPQRKSQMLFFSECKKKDAGGQIPPTPWGQITKVQVQN